MTSTTASIEQHKQALDEFESNPMFQAFETYVEYKLKDKDIEILGLHKKIDMCLKEIRQINLLLSLSDKIEK